MKLMHVFVASTAAFLILGSGAAKAGQTINDVGSHGLRERQVGCEGA